MVKSPKKVPKIIWESILPYWEGIPNSFIERGNYFFSYTLKMSLLPFWLQWPILWVLASKELQDVVVSYDCTVDLQTSMKKKAKSKICRATLWFLSDTCYLSSSLSVNYWSLKSSSNPLNYMVCLEIISSIICR